MRFLSFLFTALLLCSPTLYSQDKDKDKDKEKDKSPVEQALSGFSFRSVGPAFMSGRIADIAIDPKN